MNEAQVDTLIADIAQEMEILRAWERQPVTLSDAENDEIATLSENLREERRNQLLIEANAKKKDRMSLLISAIEDKIKASGLPAQTVKELLNVIEQSKNAGWSFSPDALKNVEDIKNKQNVVENKKEEVKQADITLENIAVATATAGVVAAVVNEAVEEKEEKAPESISVKPSVSMFKPVAGTFIINEEMALKNPERVEKIERVAKGAMGKMDTNGAPPSWEMVEQAKNICPYAKKCLKAVMLKENPALAEDLKKQEEVVNATAGVKSIARNHHKITGENPDKNKPENAPKYENEDEERVMKLVKKMKQSAGTSLTSFEICQNLNETDAAIFENYDRRVHPEFYANRDKEAARQMAEKENGPKQAVAKNDEKIKNIILKHIEALENGKGTTLSPEEILASLHPTLAKHCQGILLKDPDFLKNRNKEAETTETPAENQAIASAEKTDNVLPPMPQTIVAMQTANMQSNARPKKSRLHRTMELRSTQDKPRKKQHSTEMAKNAAFVNKRKKSVA